MGPDYFMPSEVARLVLGYLEDASCPKAYKIFREECADLREHNQVAARRGIDSTKVNGQSLLDVLDRYIDLLNKSTATESRKTMKVMIDHMDGDPCQPKITITPVAHQSHTDFRHQASPLSQYTSRCSRRGSQPEVVRQKVCSSKGVTSPIRNFNRNAPCSSQTSEPAERGHMPCSSERLTHVVPVPHTNRPSCGIIAQSTDSINPAPTSDASGHGLESYADVRTPFSVPFISPSTPVEIPNPLRIHGTAIEVNEGEDIYRPVFSVPLHSPGTPASGTPRLMISSPVTGINDVSQDGQREAAGHCNQPVRNQDRPDQGNATYEKPMNGKSNGFQEESHLRTPTKDSFNSSYDGGLLKTPRRKKPPKRKGGGSGASSNNNSNESHKMSSTTLEQEVQQLLSSIEFAEKLAENINLVTKKSGEPENETESKEDQDVTVTESEEPTPGTSGTRRQSFEMEPPEVHNMDTNFPFQSRQEAKKLEDDALRDIIDMTRNDPEFDALFNIFPAENTEEGDKTSNVNDTQGNEETSLAPTKQLGYPCGINVASDDGRTDPGVAVTSVPPPTCISSSVGQPVLSIQMAPPQNSVAVTYSVAQSQPSTSDIPIVCENSQTNVGSSNDSDRYPLVHAVAIPSGGSVVDLPNCGQQLVKVVHPFGTTTQSPVQTIQILSIDPPKRLTSGGSLGYKPILGQGITSVPCSSNVTLLPSMSHTPIASIDTNSTQACKLKVAKDSANITTPQKIKTSKPKSHGSVSIGKTTPKKRRRRRTHASDVPKRVTRSSSRAHSADRTSSITNEGSGKGAMTETSQQPIVILQDTSIRGLKPLLPKLAPRPSPMEIETVTALLSMPLIFSPTPTPNVTLGPAVACGSEVSEPVVVQAPVIAEQQMVSAPNNLPVPQSETLVVSDALNDPGNSSEAKEAFSTINAEQLSDCIDLTANLSNNGVQSDISPKNKKKQGPKFKRPKSRLSLKKHDGEQTSNETKSTVGKQPHCEKSDAHKSSRVAPGNSKKTPRSPVTQKNTVKQTPCDSGDSSSGTVLTYTSENFIQRVPEVDESVHDSAQNKGQLQKYTNLQINLSNGKVGQVQLVASMVVASRETEKRSDVPADSHKTGQHLVASSNSQELQPSASHCGLDPSPSSEERAEPEEEVPCSADDDLQNAGFVTSKELSLPQPSAITELPPAVSPRSSGDATDAAAGNQTASNEGTEIEEQHMSTSADLAQSSFPSQDVNSTEKTGCSDSKSGFSETKEVNTDSNVNKKGICNNNNIGDCDPAMKEHSNPQTDEADSSCHSSECGGNKPRTDAAFTMTAMVHTPLYSPISNDSPAPLSTDQGECLSSQKKKKVPRRIRPTLLTREISSSVPSSPVNDLPDQKHENEKSDHKEKAAKKKKDKKTEVVKKSASRGDSAEQGSSVAQKSLAPDRLLPNGPSSSVCDKSKEMNGPGLSACGKTSESSEQASSLSHKSLAPDAAVQNGPKSSVSDQTGELSGSSASACSSSQVPPLKSVSDVLVSKDMDEKQQNPRDKKTETPKSCIAKSPNVYSHQDAPKETLGSPWHEGLQAASPWQFQQPDSNQASNDTVQKVKDPEGTCDSPKEKTVVQPSNNERKDKKVTVRNGDHKTKNSTVKGSTGGGLDVKKGPKVTFANPNMFRLATLVEAAAEMEKQMKSNVPPEKKALKRKRPAHSPNKERQKSGSPISKQAKRRSQEAGTTQVVDQHKTSKSPAKSSSGPSKVRRGLQGIKPEELIARLSAKLKNQKK